MKWSGPSEYCWRAIDSITTASSILPSIVVSSNTMTLSNGQSSPAGAFIKLENPGAFSITANTLFCNPNQCSANNPPCIWIQGGVGGSSTQIQQNAITYPTVSSSSTSSSTPPTQGIQWDLGQDPGIDNLWQTISGVVYNNIGSGNGIRITTPNAAMLYPCESNWSTVIDNLQNYNPDVTGQPYSVLYSDPGTVVLTDISLGQGNVNCFIDLSGGTVFNTGLIIYIAITGTLLIMVMAAAVLCIICAEPEYFMFKAGAQLAKKGAKNIVSKVKNVIGNGDDSSDNDDGIFSLLQSKSGKQPSTTKSTTTNSKKIQKALSTLTSGGNGSSTTTTYNGGGGKKLFSFLQNKNNGGMGKEMLNFLHAKKT